MSRKQNSLRNMLVGIVGQAVVIVLQFINRTFFVHTLSSDYLGVNGLFSNILNVLSLAELGFGSAIIYSMYKPVANNDEIQITALVNLYRKIYKIIGVTICILGLLLTPFLDIFIKDTPKINNLTLIYLLYLTGTVSSYFFIYKSAVIDAHQKNYLVTIYQKTILILQNLLQIIVLYLSHNFILYLMIQIFMGILSNVLISHRADKMYPYINKNKKVQPSKEVTNEIVKNTFAMSCHKIGGIVVNNTDNILMSSLVSLSSVGIYSNYILIINNVRLFINLIFNAFTASIGNLGVSGNKEKLYSIFKILNFIGFWIFSYCSFMLFVFLSPFISLWVGESYVFSTEVLFCIILNFYLTGMRQVPLKFRDSLGLFWHDRYKPIFESGINLIVSITLAKRYGISGILIGTVISTITTSLWVEPFILYKYGFFRKLSEYFNLYAMYTMSFLICAGITYYITFSIKGNVEMLIIKAIVCTIIYNLMITLIFWRTNEMKTLIRIIADLFSMKLEMQHHH